MEISQEIIDKINTQITGEIYYESGELVWYTEDDSEDAEDNLWEEYCEASQIIRKEIPNCEIVDSWQDNDSAGFTIRILE